MAGGAEITKGAFGFAGPLSGAFNAGRKALGGYTGAERAADQAQQDAIQAAKDDLELKKQVAAANNKTAQDAINYTNGQASDAEITQILQMMKNGYTPEQISEAGYGNNGADQGADYSMFTGKAPAQAPTQAPAASTSSRAPVQSAPVNGLSNIGAGHTDWSSLGGPITDGYGETYTPGADGEYRNEKGERYQPADGTGRSFEGASPTGQTGVSTDPQLGGAGQDPNIRFEIDPTTGGYVPGKTRVEFGQKGGNTGAYVPKGFEGTAAKGPGIGDFDPALVAQATAFANKGRWSQKGEYDKQLEARQGIYAQLKSDLEGIQDPEAKAALAPVINAALRSDQTKGQQQFAMDKLKGLTDVRETAEERLMREVSRRNQENQMVSQRKATMGNLAARGQLGSGAELASMLGAQASTSGNRVMDEMAANANAQKRAIDALGKYSDMGLQLGNQDITEGAQKNAVGEFNNNLTEQHNQFATKNEQQNKHDKTKRIATVADAGNDVVNSGERAVGNLVTTRNNQAALKIGTATGGVAMTSPAATGYAGKVVTDAERRLAEEDAQGGGVL